MMATVILKKGEGRYLKAGGMWVYDNEIAKINGDFSNGDIVKVVDFDGFFLGTGFINTKSKITVRIMSRKDVEINQEFIDARVKTAVDYRMAVGDTGCCRLIFGEADFLPGLIVDKYSDILVVQSLALGIDILKPMILDALKRQLKNHGIIIRGVYERSDAKVRLNEGMERHKGFIGEPFDTGVLIEENAIKYMIDVAEGQKTGYFLDQKYNRLAIRNISKGAKVLDCFTHIGSFALNAAAGGAASVLGVDLSEDAVAAARQNSAANNFDDRVKFVAEDVFELLPRLVSQSEKFDVVILDPPAFTKSSASVKGAVRGYREINYRAMSILNDGGFLVTCSCSHFITEELFRKTIAAAAKDAHKLVRQVEMRSQAADHPYFWGAGESNYLKFYVLQIFSD